MKVIIAGSSGMIGQLLLSQGLADPKVEEVRSLVRKPTGNPHPKLKEMIVSSFTDYSQHNEWFSGIDKAFFCLGVYTGQVSTEELKKITVDYAVAFAAALEKNSPGSTLCLLSGAGADRSEKSRTPFALFKGMAENRIAKMNLNFYAFRPGYIYPVTPRNEPNLAYKIMRGLYPLIRMMGNKYSIPSTELAKAMFHISMSGADKKILENDDILRYFEINSACSFLVFPGVRIGCSFPFLSRR